LRCSEIVGRRGIIADHGRNHARRRCEAIEPNRLEIGDDEPHG
jgi:hypothetical protein